MSPSSPPVFGKRVAPAMVRPAPVAATPAGDHAAFFAAVRAEMAETGDVRDRVVPRSFTAALLAGLVTGCALAGFAVTGGGTDPLSAVSAAFGLRIETTGLLPALILLGLLGGARAAAMTVLLVHWLLSRAGWTGHLAYALGGAAASATLAGGIFVLSQHAPAHGWTIELASGAAAGFFYRVFAGSRAA